MSFLVFLGNTISSLLTLTPDFLRNSSTVHSVVLSFCFLPSLIRVTVNACYDFLRKKKYRNHLSLDEIHHLKTEEETENNGVLEVLGELSERYKAVIILHYLEGYSIDEISFMLGISASAVKMRLSRGRDLLKNLMEKED